MGSPLSIGRQPVELDDALAALMERVPTEDRYRLVEAFAELGSGRKKARAEYRVVGDDGVERWIESAATAEFDRDGRPEADIRHKSRRHRADGRPQGARRRRATRRTRFCQASPMGSTRSIPSGGSSISTNARSVTCNKSREDVSAARCSRCFRRSRTARSTRGTRRRWPSAQRSSSRSSRRSFCAGCFSRSIRPAKAGSRSISATSPSRSGSKASAAAKIEAERANQAKSKFLAAASHDLRQPVQSLVLQMALAERQIAGNPPALETLDRMRGSLEGLNGLLNAILDISRLDAGVEAQPEAVDLGGSHPPARDRIQAEGRSASVSPSGWRRGTLGRRPIRRCSSAPCAT